MHLLRNPSFLLLWSGRVVTNIADSIYYIAAMWLVYDLTGDAFYTGSLPVIMVLSILPIVSFIQQFVYPAQTKLLPEVVRGNIH